MREDTKQRLERAIWLQRGKWVAIGLAGIAVMAGVMTFMASNAAQTLVRVPATVVSVNQQPTADNPPNLIVMVKLADGKPIRVFASVKANPKVGEQVEITEHQFANGNRTYTWN
jgi:uncharacterized OB-fold protein